MKNLSQVENKVVTPGKENKTRAEITASHAPKNGAQKDIQIVEEKKEK
jgi:hypothetical protein